MSKNRRARDPDLLKGAMDKVGLGFGVQIVATEAPQPSRDAVCSGLTLWWWAGRGGLSHSVGRSRRRRKSWDVILPDYVSFGSWSVGCLTNDWLDAKQNPRLTGTA
jgi:hypothetical protein